MFKQVYIIDAKRSAVGKYGGSLVSVPATRLGAITISGLLSSRPQVKAVIDEVIIGNVLSAGLGQNPARLAAAGADLPDTVPAMTINKVCGSGLKSVQLGAQAIQTGEAEIVVAGGMENMSRCPYLLNGYRFGVKFGDQTLADGMLIDGLFCQLAGVHMGVTAEKLVRKFHLSRKKQDEYSYHSHQKALAAIDNGRFKEEIVPVKIDFPGEHWFDQDEQPRRDTTFAKLASLPPVFKKGGTVTAASSSSFNDGAAMVLLASERALVKNHLTPKAIIRSWAYLGTDPWLMGLGAYYAARECLARVKMKPDQVDLWEINEAFASQALAVLSLLAVDPQKVNVNGGAIALGHPIGASGSRILTTLLSELRRKKLRYGLASLCIGGGGGIAMLIEAL